MHQRIPLVKAVMTPFPYSVQVGSSIEDARTLMEEHDIRHLPVVDGEVLVGVISDRDLQVPVDQSAGRSSGSERVVGDICQRDVFAVELTERLDGVLDEMLARRIGSAIVVKAGRIVGIFTTVDACRFLRKLLGEFFPSDDSYVA